MNQGRTCRVFALLADGKPVLTFEATGISEANQLRNERWLWDDLNQLKSKGLPLWDGKAKLTVRQAVDDERQLYHSAAKETSTEDGELVLAYLTELDQ